MLVVIKTAGCGCGGIFAHPFNPLRLIVSGRLRKPHVFIVVVFDPVQGFVVFAGGRLPSVVFGVLDGEKVAFFFGQGIPDRLHILFPVFFLSLGQVPIHTKLFLPPK